MLKIVTYPNKILRKIAKKVSVFDNDLQKLVEHMAETMFKADGVGLAAVQVNEDKSLFVLGKKNRDYQAFINPEITFFSKEKQSGEEGCLSLPGIYGLVPRAKKIHLKYQDLSGKVVKEKFKGFEAVVIQHECDHLNGVLFIDRTNRITAGQEILDKLLK